MKKPAVVGVIVLLTLILAVGVILLRDDRATPPRIDDEASARPAQRPAFRSRPKRAPHDSPSAVSFNPRTSALAEVSEDDDEDELSPEERNLKDRIEKAQDDEDLKAAIQCVAQARVCPNKEVRQAMVDALGWFGKSALPELTPFLADVDEDVRESASSEWSSAVSDIEDESEKIAAVEMAMNVISDEDFLEDLSNEYIGVDEKIAVESLVRIIADGKSEQGVAKAKETYEFVTGDEWQGAEEARRWLAEEYEPPEG